jgi:hypothetical protein
LKLAGLPAITALPFMDARLSPVTPRLPNNGGEITLAFGLTQFVGATSDQPDGAYSLASSGTGYAAVFLRLATEVNKFHILDCRVQVSQSAKLTFLHSGGSGTSNPPVEDGHVVYAFKANASKTDVTVGFQPLSNTGNTFNLGSFYGCEVVK